VVERRLPLDGSVGRTQALADGIDEVDGNKMKAAGALSDQILERAKAGDGSAFEALYDAYKNQVYTRCLKMTGDIQDAEDLTQEVFVRVYRKVNGFRGDAAFSTWLYRVTFNTIMMHLRKRRIELRRICYVDDCVTRDITDDQEAPHCCRYHPVDHIALARALSGLGEVTRQAVVLHDIKGMTYREIAMLAGVPASTSKAQVWRARRQIRGILRPIGWNEKSPSDPNYKASSNAVTICQAASQVEKTIADTVVAR
jgi:RNA polymerase sigma-70 factor (ECF subfamily)